jgi:hypothetical protein
MDFHLVNLLQLPLQEKFVGDSPELARGLDSFGFADLETAIAVHAV